MLSGATGEVSCEEDRVAGTLPTMAANRLSPGLESALPSIIYNYMEFGEKITF